MVLSALSFSLMSVCVKQLEGAIPVAEVVLARSVVSLALSWWLLKHLGLNPWGERRRMLVLRGLWAPWRSIAFMPPWRSYRWQQQRYSNICTQLSPPPWPGVPWGSLPENEFLRPWPLVGLGCGLLLNHLEPPLRTMGCGNCDNRRPAHLYCLCNGEKPG